MSTFGCLAAGRLVSTNFTVLDDTHETLTLENADSINHICIFMTGTQALPTDAGAAGAIYLSGCHTILTTFSLRLLAERHRRRSGMALPRLYLQ